MWLDKIKEQILKDSGCKYDYDRELYVHRMKKKIFSLNAIEDNDEKWLKDCINKKNEDCEFYFNQPPNENVKRQLIKYFTDG